MLALCLHGGQRAVAADDGGGPGRHEGAVGVAAHDVAVLGQFLLDGGVGGFAFALDVDQELQAAIPLGVDGVALLAADQVPYRIEVEALQGQPGWASSRS